MLQIWNELKENYGVNNIRSIKVSRNQNTIQVLPQDIAHGEAAPYGDANVQPPVLVDVRFPKIQQAKSSQDLEWICKAVQFSHERPLLIVD